MSKYGINMDKIESAKSVCLNNVMNLIETPSLFAGTIEGTVEADGDFEGLYNAIAPKLKLTFGDDVKYLSTKHGIKRVIISNPATIIIWEDDTKTIVKCKKDEKFDPEKGIAMAIVKHVFFNDKTTQANKWFEKTLKPYYEEQAKTWKMIEEAKKKMLDKSITVEPNVNMFDGTEYVD